jgi:hypothetical protein
MGNDGEEVKLGDRDASSMLMSLQYFSNSTAEGGWRWVQAGDMVRLPGASKPTLTLLTDIVWPGGSTDTPLIGGGYCVRGW